MIKTLLVVLLIAGPVWAQEQAADALATAGCGPNKVEFEVKKDKKQHPTGQVEPGRHSFTYLAMKRGMQMSPTLVAQLCGSGLMGPGWERPNTSPTFSFR